MEMRQSWYRAADTRTSRRTYLTQRLTPETAAKLRKMAEECNREGGLNMRFVEHGEELFQGLKGGGMLRGVPSYVALAAPKSLAHRQEKLGYYGELLVLECTAMGLGTCWVSGTYDHNGCKEQIRLTGDEELSAIITVGMVSPEKSLKEKVVSVAGRRRKPLSDWITPSQGLPDWVVQGVETARKAPSAMNSQPVQMRYENGAVQAFVDLPEGVHGLDLGIAMAHFELGAWSAGAQGKWKPGHNGYVFEL